MSLETVDCKETAESPDTIRLRQTYARTLERLVRVALVLLSTTLFLYLSGSISPRIPISNLSQYWGLPLKQYLQATHTPTGWHWVQFISKSDYLCLVSVMLLGCVAILCYLRILPLLFHDKKKIHLGIAIIQITVLLLAVSGLLKISH